MQRYDVIVVGAGPAGSATAFFLAQAGVNVLLLDKAGFPRDKTCGDCLSPRAQHVLKQMCLLNTLDAQGHQAPAVHLYAPNGACAVAPVCGGSELSNYTLIVPRYLLDHAVQQQAIAAGADFRVGRVDDVVWEHSRAAGVSVNGYVYSAALVVLATGATTGLLQKAGLLSSRPHFSVAARRYYEELPGPGAQLEIYFNEVPMPGYSWMFPTGPHSANVGFWYSGTWPLSARAAFEPIAQHHPRLSTLLAAGRPASPLKSYPIRTDFLRAPKLRPGLLAVGEAAGLVNPLTGEGIDYALESGQIAAQTIATALEQGEPTSRTLQPYVRRLYARFGKLFLMMQLLHRYLFNGPMFSRVFGSGPQNQHIVDTMIGICFGGADPGLMLNPRIAFDLLRSG